LPADRGNVVRAAQRLPRPRRRGADRRGCGGRVLQDRTAVMDALELLTDADLATLAAALRSGRLHAPFTPVSLQRFCSPADAGETAARLQELHDEGMKPEHLALLVETTLRTRARLPQQDALVDLVWTGPETLGAANRDTGVVVRELFGSAEVEVLV